jgi:hypothetical protein
MRYVAAILTGAIVGWTFGAVLYIFTGDGNLFIAAAVVVAGIVAMEQSP